MSSRNTAHIDFAPGEQRLFRYTIVTLSAVTLVAAFVFVFWVLGQIIGTLHALIFPLAIAAVLALVLFPVVELFERFLRMSRLGAVISLFGIMFGLFLLLVVLVLPTAIYQSSQFLQSVPEMAERGYDTLSGRFPKAFPMIEDALSEMDI